MTNASIKAVELLTELSQIKTNVLSSSNNAVLARCLTQAEEYVLDALEILQRYEPYYNTFIKNDKGESNAEI